MSKNRTSKTSRFHDLAIEKPALVGIILALGVFACFLPAAWYGFINMDDLPLIAANKVVNEASLFDQGRIFSKEIYTPYYKPLTQWSWIFERVISGSVSPHVIHFDNALLHGVNSFLVFMLSLKITDKMWPKTMGPILTAMMCALFWGWHPFRLESVVWAVERKDVLFGMFYLSACLSYFKYVTQGRKNLWLLITVLLYLLSCLSKSMGITFFAAALLIEVLCIGTDAFKLPKLWSKVPLILTMLFVLHLQGLFFSPENPAKRSRVVNVAKGNVYVPGPLAESPSTVQFLAIANMRLAGFAGHFMLPVKPSIIYPREKWIEQLGLGIFALFAIPLFFLALFVLKKKTRPTIGFGLVWFAATISPVLVSDATGTNFLSDRYTYIPSLGLIWIIVPGLVRLFPTIVRGTFTVGHGISAVSAIVFMVFTVTQMPNWRTSIKVWNNVIDKYPINWYGYYNRAKLISDEDPAGAISDLNKSIDYVDNQAIVYFARGTILMEQGNREGAIADFSNAIRFDSRDVQSYINRGSCYRGLKQYDAAIADYTTALSLGSMDNKALNNRALTYMDQGRLDLALADLNRLLESSPDYSNALLNRANLFVRAEFKRFQEAIADYDKYLQYEPDTHEALFRRGYAKAQLGGHSEAIADFNRAIELQPNQGFYYFGRAQSLEQLGRKSEALTDVQRTEQLGIRVDPEMIARLSKE